MAAKPDDPRLDAPPPRVLPVLYVGTATTVAGARRVIDPDLALNIVDIGLVLRWQCGRSVLTLFVVGVILGAERCLFRDGPPTGETMVSSTDVKVWS